MKLKILFLFLLISHLGFSQTAHSHLRNADEAYESQDFSGAEIDYRKALEKTSNASTTYNLGNSVYQQSRFEEAVKHYPEAAAKTQDKLAKANAYHNLGNAYFHALMVYLTLNTGFNLNALNEMIKGVDVVRIFDSPFLMSRTPTEFWTERWNLMIQNILKVNRTCLTF